MSSVTDFLLNRASEPRLEAPAPDAATLDRAFRCAARAPDHALLRPWRYLVIEGEDLDALGEVLAVGYSDLRGKTDDKKLDIIRNKAHRSPMIIVGIASPKPHPKVPEVEQILSAGASMSYLGLSLQDAGYGVMWRTGELVYNRLVLEGLGLEEGESIIGFLYTGTVSSNKPAVPRPELSEFVARWPG
ncbi:MULTISPECIES: nitroreductase family protein [Marinobacter]|uniref:Putative NAD(P)H nitroreductase n=1 Tax=Marinobacter xiaoshiensis TaxID=3073652 RepID=A0ABU2HHG4_9GAMM|nr:MULTISPECIES: nitroreductase [unclassified Marinobacter]MBK1874887.1 nitroreductase [Marinobacter sp. 1-3A]MBK1887662.1 nitroreductase [Marinobacter sp. DY40_1A1]MDS1310061.1 nitroreductase [Marinobacter sp. F60267]